MTVELWRGADARWRWRYVEPTQDGRPLVLHGNKHHATRAEALRSASTAYPGVPVLERTPAPPRRRRLRWLLAAAAVILLWSLARPRARG